MGWSLHISPSKSASWQSGAWYRTRLVFAFRFTESARNACLQEAKAVRLALCKPGHTAITLVSLHSFPAGGWVPRKGQERAKADTQGESTVSKKKRQEQALLFINFQLWLNHPTKRFASFNAYNCPVRPVLYSHLTDEQTEG